MEQDKHPTFIKNSNKTYGLMEVVDGTSPMAEKAPEDTVETFPHYLLLLTICSLAVTLILLIISLFFNAPLEELANPLVTPNPGKAPWYFTGIQELIHYTNKPVIPAIIIPMLIVIWLASFRITRKFITGQREAQSALRERVKELDCLYGIKTLDRNLAVRLRD